jgi:Holliday junction resolvase
MSNYRRGRAFEYRVMDYFRKLGFFVMRSAGSHGPVDLVALKKGSTWVMDDLDVGKRLTQEVHVVFIQCKTDGKMLLEERSSLLELARQVGAKAFVISISRGSKRGALKIEVL